MATTKARNTLLNTYECPLAPNHLINESGTTFLPPTAHSTRHCIPRLFPIPHSWWPIFLETTPMVLNAYEHIKALTNGWNSPQAKQAARAA